MSNGHIIQDPDESAVNWYTQFPRHFGNCYAYAFGKHLIGDCSSGGVYEMRTDVYTDDGNQIISFRQTPILYDKNDNQNVFIHRLEVELEAGTANEDVENPQISLQWSKDGKVWSNEYARGMGKVGQYTRRVIWERLGRARDRIFLIKITDAVKRIIVGATVK